MVESIERRPPKTGRLEAIVLEAFRKGKPLVEVQEENQVPIGTLQNAVRRLKKRIDFFDPLEIEAMKEWQRHSGAYGTSKFRDRISEARGGRRIKVLPLLLRGASSAEASNITGYSRQDVINVAAVCRKAEELPKSPLPKSSESQKGIPNQQASLELARRLVENKLITQDLTFWRRLHELYGNCDRTLPNDFAVRLILEVFLAARRQVEQGDKSLLRKYIQLGEEVDPELLGSKNLGEEQKFITDSVHKLEGKSNNSLLPQRIERAIAQPGEGGLSSGR